MLGEAIEVQKEGKDTFCFQNACLCVITMVHRLYYFTLKLAIDSKIVRISISI